MNIDELISKYLDGELSEHEDALLRSKMSENPLKKADFDDAIFMHHALKEDAKSIKLPEGLARDTQDLVLMKILNEQPIILKLQKRRRVINRLSSAVAAVLVLGFAFISEFPNMKYLNTLYTYQAKELQKTKQAIIKAENNQLLAEAKLPKPLRTVSVIKNGISNSTNSMLAAKDAFKLLAPKSEDESSVIASNQEFANIGDTNSVESNPKLNSNIELAIDASNSIKTDKASLLNNNSESIINKFNTSNSESIDFTSKPQSGPAKAVNLVSGKNAIINQFIDAQQMNSGIELGTCYGNNLSNNVFSDGESKFSVCFSQSIGVRLNEVSKFGFEFGYMNFSVSQTNMISVPINSSNSSGYSVEIQKDNGIPGPTIKVPIKSTVDSRTIWGTVFYEYKALDLDWFSLDARIGLGGTKDGLLNLGRVLGTIEVIHGFSLMAGLDGRLFYTTVPKTNNSDSRLRSAVSLIYGIQFNF